MRQLSEKELVHERLGDRFALELSTYDTERRIHVLVDTFLGGNSLKDLNVLDVGAGLGFFSEAMQRRGANVTAIDIGSTLLRRVKERVGCRCMEVDALNLVNTFGKESFDVVLSSECIEHTPDPDAALRQMCKVLKAGGRLSVSTPNRLWQPVVKLATKLRLRAFDGLENFSSFRSIGNVLASENVQIKARHGLHLFPFQIPLHSLSRWCDDHLQKFQGQMINICVLGQKKTTPTAD